MVEYLEPTNTVAFNPAGPNNPDALCVVSRDANAAAALAIVLPLKPIGTSVLLQIVHSAEPSTPYQFWHTIATGDTPASVAQSFADAITANTTLQAAGIAGQYVGGTQQFGISHRVNDALTISAAAWDSGGHQIIEDNGGSFTFPSQGGNALDAGPQFVLTRDPVGWAPTAGSNIAQFVGQARVSSGAMVQYGTACVNIVNPNAGSPRGEWEFDTVGLVNGQLSIAARLFIGLGVYACVSGSKLADKGEGSINMMCYYLNGRQIAVRADGTLYLA